MIPRISFDLSAHLNVFGRVITEAKHDVLCTTQKQNVKAWNGNQKVYQDKKVRMSRSQTKGIIHFELINQGQTVDQHD